MTKTVVFSISLALFFLGASELHAQPQPPGVIVSEARIQPFPLSSEALGNARANEAVDIRPEITAAITAIHFKEGQSVAKGEVLLKLVNSEPLADLAAARAALVDSTSQFRRSEELFKTRGTQKNEP